MSKDTSRKADENEANVPDPVLKESQRMLKEAKTQKAKEKAAEAAKAKESDKKFLSGIEKEYSELADKASRMSGSYPMDFLRRRSELDNAIDRETIVNARDNGYKKLSPVERQKLQQEGKLAEADRREAARAKLIRSAAMKGVQFDEQGRVKMKKGGEVNQVKAYAKGGIVRGGGIESRGKTRGKFV